MAAYFEDLRVFFQRAAATGVDPIVLHVEPDLWGYVQRSAARDDARTVPAQVGSTGLTELAGLPDNVAGFAQAIVRLRDPYAPNVLLGYHVSVWGTGDDISFSDPPDDEIDALAGRTAAFYRSLGAGFDLLRFEFADRDAGYRQHVDGAGRERMVGPGRLPSQPALRRRVVEHARPAGRPVADPARQHAHARDGQHPRPLPGQPRADPARLAARRARALPRCRRRRLPVRPCRSTARPAPATARATA